MAASRSQRLVDALRQLEQFLPAQGQSDAVCTLSGVRVTPDPASDHEDGAMLQLTFPGSAEPILVIGEIYLKLKIIESVRLEFDSGEDGSSTKIGGRVQDLLEHLTRKHDL